jgi:hypothetical protein
MPGGNPLLPMAGAETRKAQNPGCLDLDNPGIEASAGSLADVAD